MIPFKWRGHPHLQPQKTFSHVFSRENEFMCFLKFTLVGEAPKKSVKPFKVAPFEAPRWDFFKFHQTKKENKRSPERSRKIWPPPPPWKDPLGKIWWSYVEKSGLAVRFGSVRFPPMGCFCWGGGACFCCKKFFEWCRLDESWSKSSMMFKMNFGPMLRNCCLFWKIGGSKPHVLTLNLYIYIYSNHDMTVVRLKGITLISRIRTVDLKLPTGVS